MEGLIEIRPSPGKGLGVFALEDITPGTLIHSESPTLIIPKAPWSIKDDDITTALSSLTPSQHDDFLALSAPPTHQKTHAARIFFGNGFAYPYPGNVQSTCVCLRTARFNHSCLPNAEMAFHPLTGHCELFATSTIAKGEEICFCYLQESHCMPRSYRQFMHFLTWRFVCRCAACEASASSPEFCEASDRRREAMYNLRARLENFSLPVLSLKRVMGTGIPIAEVWKPGELQQVLTKLWMPQPPLLAYTQETRDQQIAGWTKLLSYMQEERLNGKEISRYCSQLVPLLLEKATADNIDGSSPSSSSEKHARWWADRGLASIKSCRSPRHPSIIEYEKQHNGWALSPHFE